MRLLHLAALAIAGGAAVSPALADSTETFVLREVSQRTFLGTLNDLGDHPVSAFGPSGPVPTGPGRGAGDAIFINNLLFDPVSQEPRGSVHGFCWTVDHGAGGRYMGPPMLGAGGPFQAACQLSYALEKGQIIVSGNLDQTALERDQLQTLAIVGGTGSYANARGVLTLKQDPPRQPVSYRVTVTLRGVGRAPVPFDVKKPAWFGGMQVTAFAQLPAFAGGVGPSGPSDELDDQVVYLIGNVDADDPFGPEIRIPAIGPDGRPVLDPSGNPVIVAVVPAHDDTFTEFATDRHPFDAFGKWVVPGPNARSDNVRTRPQPDKSIAGAPLVYAIRVGDRFRPLTSRQIVQQGLNAGLLELRDSGPNGGWGGVGWLQIDAAHKRWHRD